MIRKAVVLSLVCVMSACSITPKPLTTSDRYEESVNDLKELFAQQVPSQGNLDFYEALARGLKYNLDYRIKRVNSALQAGQLEVALFTMFPALNTSGSVYNRNNEYASSGITTTDAPTDILNSTPNTVRSARVAFTWNILDFGLGYVKAKQQGERYLIAQEEARKQIQQLTQDVLIAYWSAYSAQELMVSATEFKSILTHAKQKLSAAMLDKEIPKQSILDYEGALLDGNRKLIQLQYKYDKAVLDLKHLLNLPPNMKLTLSRPPLTLRQIHDLSHLDFRKMDALTLVNRPELRGQNYQQRIAKWGIKTVILQSLPGITLNEGWNYNSNKFLLNTVWVDRSVDVAWNLLNVASLPSSFKAADTQVEYEKLKLMALTLTALTETRYAYSHYETLRNEYVVAHKQTQNANAIFTLDRDRQRASLASDQQVIIAKLHTLTARMDEDLLLSDLSTSLGELYSSVGMDILPTGIESKSLQEVTDTITGNFAKQTPWDFANYVDYTYNRIFADHDILLADNGNHDTRPILDTVNSISTGDVETLTPSKPLRQLTAVTKHPVEVLPAHKSEPFFAIRADESAPSAKPVIVATAQLVKKPEKEQIDGESNLKILETRLATSEKKTASPVSHPQTVLAEKSVVTPGVDLKSSIAQLKPKPVNLMNVAALLNKKQAPSKNIKPVAVAIVAPKKSVVPKSVTTLASVKPADHKASVKRENKTIVVAMQNPKPVVAANAKPVVLPAKPLPTDKLIKTALLATLHKPENKNTAAVKSESVIVAKQSRKKSSPARTSAVATSTPVEPHAKPMLPKKIIKTAALSPAHPSPKKAVTQPPHEVKKALTMKTSSPVRSTEPASQANKMLVAELLSDKNSNETGEG